MTQAPSDDYLLNLINPRTLTTESFTAHTTAQVKDLVDRARNASLSWSKLSFKERSQKIKTLAQAITQGRAEGSAMLVQETGRAQSMLALSEFNNVITFADTCIREAKIALQTTKIKLSPLDWPGKSAYVEQLPRGVVGIIAPWNYPLSNFYKSLFPALLSGNTVVIKPSEYTPKIGQWLTDLSQSILGQDVIVCAQGGAAIGNALISSGINALVFTGSVKTGKIVAGQAAQQLIPCSLELGGKDAALVLEDADLERSALGIAQWSMFNSGQDCSSIERVYVLDSIADQFLTKLTTTVSKLTYHGDGSLADDQEADVGPLQNQQQLQTIEAQVQDALSKGAQVLCGGKTSGQGYGYAPTVLDHCNQQMSVVTEESFGPIIAVIRVPNSSEAIKQINASQYGLNGSVWTKDLKKGAELAQQLEVGVALVNNHSFTGSMPQFPWTGVKNTGYGIASSRWGYHNFIRPHTVVIDKNKDPDPFWLPVDQSYQQFAEAIAQKNLGAGLGLIFKLLGLLKQRIKATRNLLK